MSYPLTVEAFRALVTSSATDGYIQALLDAAQVRIDAKLGPPATDVSELISVRGELIMLSRAASEITAVFEAGHALDPADFELRPGGTIVRRLRTGQWPYIRGWRGGIDISYTPIDDSADRERLQLLLVQYALEFPTGGGSERIGEYSIDGGSTGSTTYQQGWDDILSTTGQFVGIH